MNYALSDEKASDDGLKPACAVLVYIRKTPQNSQNSQNSNVKYNLELFSEASILKTKIIAFWNGLLIIGLIFNVVVVVAVVFRRLIV